MKEAGEAEMKDVDEVKKTGSRKGKREAMEEGEGEEKMEIDGIE